VTDGAALATVQRDVAEAQAIGLKATPAFFLGTRTVDGRLQLKDQLFGALPFDTFASVIDRLLDSVAPARD